MSQNNSNSVSNLTDAAMSNLRGLVDTNTIIGDPITTADGVSIIPISKVSFGYASGGSDLPGQAPDRFAGASGGGVTLQPLGFLVINGQDVKLLQMQTADNTGDRMVNAGAGVLDKIIDLIPSKKDRQEHSGKKANVVSEPEIDIIQE
ncbi:MAG: GerW family sporulation protein [Oscillospiraceae bacterium]